MQYLGCQPSPAYPHGRPAAENSAGAMNLTILPKQPEKLAKQKKTDTWQRAEPGGRPGSPERSSRRGPQPFVASHDRQPSGQKVNPWSKEHPSSRTRKQGLVAAGSQGWPAGFAHKEAWLHPQPLNEH